MRTSRFLMPHSMAALPAASAATLRGERCGFARTFEAGTTRCRPGTRYFWRSVMVMMVLLNDVHVGDAPETCF